MPDGSLSPTNPVGGIWRRNPSRTRFRASDARPCRRGAHMSRPSGRNRERETSMSDFDRNYAAARRSVGADRAVAIDQGLRAYMIRIYNYMAMGVALTGVVSWFTYQAAVVTNASGGMAGLTPFCQAIYGGAAGDAFFFSAVGVVVVLKLPL